MGTNQAVATELTSVTASNNGITVTALVVREAAMTYRMPLKYGQKMQSEPVSPVAHGQMCLGIGGLANPRFCHD